MKKIIIAAIMVLPLLSSAQTTWFAKTFTNWGGKFTQAKTGTLAQFVWYDTTLNGRIALDNYGTNGILGPSFNGRSALGTPENPLSISTDKVLLSVGGFGYTGSSFTNSANGTFTIRAAGAFIPTSTPTYLTFSTTAIGTLTNIERLRISDVGTVSIKSLTTAGFIQNAANGDLFSTDAATTRTNLGLGSVSTLNAIPYASLTNIPSTFTPSAHTHGDADITALAYGKLTGAPNLATKVNVSDTGIMLDPYKAAINGKQAAGTYAGGTGTANGSNNGDNAANTTYANDYRAANFVAGTNYALPNANTTGTASNITGNLPQSQVVNLVTDLAGKEPTIAAGTTAQYWRGDKTWQTLPVAAGSQVYVPLAANFSSVIVTEVAVTGWNITVTAGKAYRIRVSANYQTAAITTGGELGFFLVGAGTINGKLEGAIVSTATATNLQQGITAIGIADAAGSNIITTGVTAINSPHYIGGEVIFTCTTSGTLSIGWATEVAASAAQLNAGSSLIYQQLN